MKIETKYNLEEVVYGVSLDREYNDIPCFECSGEGYIIKDENKNFCPTCDGMKTVYKHTGFKFSINPFVIKSILVTKDGIEYFDHDKQTRRKKIALGKKYQEDNVFYTYDDAQRDIENLKKTDEWKNKKF